MTVSRSPSDGKEEIQSVGMNSIKNSLFHRIGHQVTSESFVWLKVNQTLVYLAGEILKYYLGKLV